MAKDTSKWRPSERSAGGTGGKLALGEGLRPEAGGSPLLFLLLLPHGPRAATQDTGAGLPFVGSIGSERAKSERL